jgi:hypothetical protein
MPLVASNPVSANFFQLFRGPFGIFQDACLMAFAACLTKCFFNLLPVPKSPGLDVATRYRIGWAVAFLTSGFLFFHLVLNKNTGIVKLIQDNGPLIFALVGLSMAVTLTLYAFSRMSAKKAVPAKA